MDIPTIVVNAGHMKDRALAFRGSFINDHLRTNSPYAISEIFRNTSMWPSSAGALKLLLKRKTIAIHDGQLSNSVGRQVEATFNPIVNDQHFTIAILFPSPLLMQASYDQNHLSIKALTPLPTTFIVKPKIDGASLLPDRAEALEFAILNSAITYTFSQVGSVKPAFILAARFDPVPLEDLANLLVRRLTAEFSTAPVVRSPSVRLYGGATCAGDQNNWYVLCDQQEHLTIVHQGTIVEGGQLQYRVIYGPDTEGNCRAWDNTNGDAACGSPFGERSSGHSGTGFTSRNDRAGLNRR